MRHTKRDFCWTVVGFAAGFVVAMLLTSFIRPAHADIPGSSPLMIYFCTSKGAVLHLAKTIEVRRPDRAPPGCFAAIISIPADVLESETEAIYRGTSHAGDRFGVHRVWAPSGRGMDIYAIYMYPIGYPSPSKKDGRDGPGRSL